MIKKIEEMRMYQTNGVESLQEVSSTKSYQEALRTAAAANAILGSAHWRRGDYHESAPLLREGCFFLWGSPILEYQLKETCTWVECFGLLGDFYLSGREDVQGKEAEQLISYVKSSFPWFMASILEKKQQQEEDGDISYTPLEVFQSLLTIHRISRSQGHVLAKSLTAAWLLIEATRTHCHEVIISYLLYFCPN